MMNMRHDSSPSLIGSAPSKFDWLFARLKIKTVLAVEDDVGSDDDGDPRPALQASKSTWRLTDDCLYCRASEIEEGGDRIPFDSRFDAVLVLQATRGVRAERMGALVADLCSVSDIAVIFVEYPVWDAHRVNHHWPEAWSRLFQARGYGCFDVFGGQPSGPDERYLTDGATLMFARRGTEAAHVLEPWNAAGLVLSRLRPEAVFSLLDQRPVSPDPDLVAARDRYAQDAGPLIGAPSAFVDVHAAWRQQIEEELAFAKAMTQIERQGGMTTGERRGREAGLREGREAGLREGREAGLREGREAGLREGREAGLREGRENGLREGREAGLREGRENGLREGRESGHRDGFDAGAAFATQEYDAEIHRMLERHEDQALTSERELQRFSRLIEGYRSSYFRKQKRNLLDFFLSFLPDALRLRWDRRARARRIRILRGSGTFDVGYYRKMYPDVGESDVDLLEHYLLYGAAEGRNPSAFFDTDAYLINHPELVLRDINPLVHSLGKPRPALSRKVP